MLELNFTKDHSEFRQSVRDFSQREIAPLIEESERTGKYPKQLLKRAAEAGLTGLMVPEEFGGSGAGVTFGCIASEETAHVCPGLGTGLTGSLGLTLLAEVGTPEQRRRYLEPTIAGTSSGAFAMTEPKGGSDVLAMDGRAVRTSSGWRIRTNKMFITGAPFCDYMFVVVYTSPERRGRGVSIFVLDRDTPGLDITPLDKLGHRSMETGAVFIDAEVPAAALLGEEGSGMSYIGSTLVAGRLTHAARSLGVARAAYEAAAKYAQERSAFGKPIGQHQAIQFKLARMFMAVRNASLNVMVTAMAYDAGEEVTAEVCAAKVVASEAAVSVASDAMQVFGGMSYMMETPVQRFLRDAYLYPISEGTTEINLRTLARSAGIGQETR